MNKNVPEADILSQLGLKEQLHCGNLTLLCTESVNGLHLLIKKSQVNLVCV